MDWSDVLRGSASFALVLVALALSYALVRLAILFTHATRQLDDAGAQAVPLLTKANVTLDQVNDQLTKADRITDSAVDAVDAADKSVRAVVGGVRTPAAKLAGLFAGAEGMFGSFRARRRTRREAGGGRTGGMRDDAAAARADGRAASEQRQRDVQAEVDAALGGTPPEQ